MKKVLIDNKLKHNDFLFDKYLLYVKDMLKYLTNYYGVISCHIYDTNDPFIRDINTNVIKICNNNILLNNIVDQLNITDNSIKCLMSVLGDMYLLKYLIESNINIIKVLNPHFTEVINIYNKLVVLQKKNNDNVYECENAIQNYICKEITNIINVGDKFEKTKKIIDIVDLLNNYVLDNILLYEIYTIILSNVIKYVESNDIQYLLNTIFLKIEQLKNKIINSEVKHDNIKSKNDFKITMMKEVNVKKSICDTNPFIKSFGLSPISKYESLSETINLIFGNKTKKKVKKELDLSDIVKELNNDYCFILLIKMIISPIEFDIWKLYDKDEFKNFKQEKNSGVNKIFIDKFNTIKFVEKNKKWDNDIKIFGSILENTEKVIILEKLNTEKYRILKKYKPPQLVGIKFNSFNERLKYQEINHYVNDKDNISGLLYFINNKQILKSGD